MDPPSGQLRPVFFDLPELVLSLSGADEASAAHAAASTQTRAP